MITYTHDAPSRLTSIAAPGLTTIGFAYDELSRRTGVAPAFAED